LDEGEEVVYGPFGELGVSVLLLLKRGQKIDSVKVF
jgi:hypothetical protein